MTAKRSLIKSSLIRSAKRNPHMFQLNYVLNGIPGQDLTGIPVDQAISPFNGVPQVFLPAIVPVLRGISQRSSYATLRRYGVRSQRPNFGNHGNIIYFLLCFYSRPKPGGSPAYDQKLMFYCLHFNSFCTIPISSYPAIDRSREFRSAI